MVFLIWGAKSWCVGTGIDILVFILTNNFFALFLWRAVTWLLDCFILSTENLFFIFGGYSFGRFNGPFLTVAVDRVDFTGLDEVLIEDILSLIKVNKLMICILKLAGNESMITSILRFTENDIGRDGRVFCEDINSFTMFVLVVLWILWLIFV